MKLRKAWTCLLLALALCLPAYALAETEAETVVALSDTGITVNGEAAPTDDGADIYVSTKVEAHEDVDEALADVENTVVTIASAGVYRFSGSLADGQIVVAAPEDAEVRVILDGVTISCRTAPVIFVQSGLDMREPGQYGVALEMADGSHNVLIGSHTVAAEEDGIDSDGAISANISLGFEGGGEMDIVGDNEGIEVKYGHLTFNGGTLRVTANDDPVNGSEDGVAVITINGGLLYLQVDGDPDNEGDGMDSNGSIVINGGTVVALSHPDSEDGGLDADLGIAVNGGTVFSAGNMYDEIAVGEGSDLMVVQFPEAEQQTIVAVGADGKAALAFAMPDAYRYAAIVLPTSGGEYALYSGGELTGETLGGFYQSIMSYTPGEALEYESDASGVRGFGGQRPGGEPPEGFDGKLPEGFDGKPPEGIKDRRPEGMDGRVPDATAEPLA